MNQVKGRSRAKDDSIKRFKDADDEMEMDSASAEFESLFKESLQQQRFAVGDIVKGTVVQFTPDDVMVDIGYKSEGRVPLAEFTGEDGQPTVQIGDEIAVLFAGRHSQQGYAILSRRRAAEQQIWDRIEAIGENGEVEGKITGKVKGGFTVDIGVEAFLPASQVDLRPGGNQDRHVGQSYTFRIIKFNRKRGNVVLSRRVILDEERGRLRGETLANLVEGAVVEGAVKNITEYGAFVDLGGVDGLLHVTDMSWGRVGNPADVIKVGEHLTVKVLKYDSEKGKISLGLKQLMEDPWITAENKYEVGSRVRGRVVSLAEYGAFIALEDGVEGLVHVSEMSWTKRVRHPSEIIKVGDVVETVVLGVDLGNRRISLGLKQTEENPWTVIAEKYPVGSIIEGEIRNITDFGMFIGIDEGIDGLVHVSDISWTKRIKHPGEIYSKGQTVQAVVLKIDTDGERVSLGVKQLTPDPWSLIPQKFRPGTKIQGKVSSVTDFGIFIEIEEGIEGLVHVSELAQEKVASAKEFAAVGDELTAIVLSVDPVDKKIGLSIKAINAANEKAEFESFMSSQGEATSNLGDLLKEELNKNGN
jgi:small subunit ribosomal protein S1